MILSESSIFNFLAFFYWHATATTTPRASSSKKAGSITVTKEGKFGIVSVVAFFDLCSCHGSVLPATACAVSCYRYFV